MTLKYPSQDAKVSIVPSCTALRITASFAHVLKMHSKFINYNPTTWSIQDGALHARWRLVQPLVSVRVQSSALRTRAVDRFSCSCHTKTRALANQNAASHLRQSGRLSGHRA